MSTVDKLVYLIKCGAITIEQVASQYQIQVTARLNGEVQ